MVSAGQVAMGVAVHHAGANCIGKRRRAGGLALDSMVGL